jgi:hypothetical protein
VVATVLPVPVQHTRVGDTRALVIDPDVIGAQIKRKRFERMLTAPFDTT